VAYAFGKDRPSGWVLARATTEKIEFELRSLNKCLPGLSQDFEFASQSARLFGFVRGASGPVTPIARAVVTAKVA
jgi:hypothetical protein